MSIAGMKVGGREVQSAMLGGAVLYSAARYEELEYIEFDGVATIDLALDHVTGYEYECIINLPSQSSAWARIFSTGIPQSNSPCTMVNVNQVTSCFLATYNRRSDFGQYFKDAPIVLGETYELVLKPTTFTINGAEFELSTNGVGVCPEPALTLGSAIAQHFLFRVKDAEGNVVCDCRPARRISDGECGMYDRARGIFLPRTSERGEVTGDYPTGRLYF